MPASRAYSDCTVALSAGGRSGSVPSGAWTRLDKGDVAARKVEGGGRADRSDPVDDFRTIRRHDHVAGVKVGMAQPVPRWQALDQGEDAGGDVLRNAVGDPGRVVEPIAQGGYIRRRGHLVNGYVEGCEDRAGLLGGDGAGSQELRQGRSVEARQHDAEAPLQGHLVEHPRRRGAGGGGDAGHSRLVLAEAPRDAGLEQLQDLTGRPRVDVRRGALADLLPRAPRIARPPTPRLLAYDFEQIV